MIKIDEKNKKKVIAGIVTAAVFIATVIIGIISYQNAPTQRLKKQLSLGDKYLAELKYEAAIAAYEAALQIDAKSEPAYAGITKAYIGLEDYEKALEAVNRGIAAVGETKALIALQNQIADHYEVMGDQYLSEINYEQAVVAYVAVLGIRKGAEDPYVGLANAYIGEEEYTKALDTVEEGINNVGETPKLVEIKTKMEELLNPPVEEPEPDREETVSENEVEEPEEERPEEPQEETQETEGNPPTEGSVAEETTPASEATQGLVVETPVTVAPMGRTVALADGSAVASGGTIPSSQLAGASYIMEGSRWFACFVDSDPYDYFSDPDSIWAFEGRYSSGAAVPLAPYGASSGSCITIITAADNIDENSYHLSYFYVR